MGHYTKEQLEEHMVRELGERIGYGRTIQLCERLWGELLPGGVSPAAHANERLAAYDAREPLVTKLVEMVMDAPPTPFDRAAYAIGSFRLAERQAAPANLESVAQPDTPDAHVGEPSAAVNAAEVQLAMAEVERLRALIAEGDFKELYAEGLMVGQRLGRAEHKSEFAELRKAVSEVFEHGGVALFRMVGRKEERVNISELLTEFNERGAKLARVEGLVEGFEAFLDSVSDDTASPVVETYIKIVAELKTALNPILGAAEADASGESGV